MTTTHEPQHRPVWRDREQLYADALRALGNMQETVERVKWMAEQTVDNYHDHCEFPEPAPTLADIGELFSFLEGLDSYTEGLVEDARRLRQALHALDGIRLDPELQAPTGKEKAE